MFDLTIIVEYETEEEAKAGFHELVADFSADFSEGLVCADETTLTVRARKATE